jgi:transposase
MTAAAPLFCTVAIELSRSRWLIGVLPPRSTKVSVRAIAGGDTARLMEHLDKTRGLLARRFGTPVGLKVCFEAGYDGFWLARLLRDRGVEVFVLDASSFLVSRRGRRAKTDRIDVEAMTFTLRAYLAGDPSVCRVVPIPTPEAEDAKRLSRERTRLAAEKTRHVNRIRGLLSLHGIRSIEGLWGGSDWRAQLDGLRTGDGRSLGRFLKNEIAREFERLHLVLQQTKVLEAERRDALLDPASPFPDSEKVAILTKLAGIGELSATLLVAEVFHRSFQNRRHLGSYLGLAPSPHASGDTHRDQGISKAGNKPARTLLVEIAWSWMRHQPSSELAAWYRGKFAGQGARGRKVGIVAVARRLAIALWRFVEHGVVPPGAILNGR